MRLHDVASLALAAVLALLAPPARADAATAVPASGWCQDRSATTARASAGATRPAGPGPRERRALEGAVQRWEEEAAAYRDELRATLRSRLEERRRAVTGEYDRSIGRLEALERGERDATIARFETFLSRYPDDPQVTPEAMFRLAELYYERSSDAFERATIAHRAEASRAVAEGREPPPEPVESYAPSIALYQQLITGYPAHPYAHAVYYLLAYCLAEMGQGEEAQAAYATLIERWPKSPFVPEAWVRLGDWYFDEVAPDALERAAAAFSSMYAYPEHPLFARAIYKLGWTWYRMDRFDRAVETFAQLLDHYVEAARRDGRRPGGDVWPEAIQYTAISFADPAWGGIDRARAFFGARGHPAYEAEVYDRLGDVWSEQTRYALAAAAWEEALAAAPLSPGAPGIRAKIVVAWARDGQREREAGAREALVAACAEGTAWSRANAGDPDALAVARGLVEQSLLGAATYHHAQAQAHERAGRGDAALAEFRAAARAYGEYLARFPRSRQAYELAYRQADCLYRAGDLAAAARAYAAVRDDPADDQYASDAALSAVISWEREIARLERGGRLPVRKLVLAAQRPEGEPVTPQPIPEEVASLVRDSDVLLARFPQHEQAPAVAYKAGEVFFTLGHLAEARCRFDEVVARWPASGVARFAANLVIESHLVARDWLAVEQAAARLGSSEAAARDPALREALRRFELGGRFNRAVQLMEASAWDEAERLFLAMVAEDPRHEFAAEALYDAASCSERAGHPGRALALYERVAAEYPAAPVAAEALFRAGYVAESGFDLERAAERFLAIAERYPRSTRRKDALYDAARCLENLQRHEQAAAAFARYAALRPEPEDAARTQFHAALLYAKMGDRKRELEALQELLRRSSSAKEPEIVVQAQLEMARAHAELGDDAGARASYEAAVSEFDRRRLRPEASPRAAAAAGEATFRLAEYELERYERIGLPATTKPKKLKQALEAKLAEARKVAARYDEVMRYRRPDWILAAFYRKAYVLERLAQTIQDAPVPPEYARKGAEEYLAAYQDALAQAAQPYEEQAIAIHVQAIEASRRLHVKNEWTRRIARSLARYRPREHPVLEEPKARLALDDLSPSRFSDTPEGPSRRPLPGGAQAAGAATTNP